MDDKGGLRNGGFAPEIDSSRRSVHNGAAPSVILTATIPRRSEEIHRHIVDLIWPINPIERDLKFAVCSVSFTDDSISPCGEMFDKDISGLSKTKYGKMINCSGFVDAVALF